MRYFLFVVAAFFFLVSLSCLPAAAPVTVSDSPIAINDQRTTNIGLPPSKPLGEMSWSDSGQRVQKLSDLKGKAVVLDFWATYCEPCRRSIPHLNALQAKYSTENLQIIGLNVGGEEDAVMIPRFTEKTKIDYPIAFPEDALNNFIFSVRSDIPQALVIDRSGNIVSKIIGFSDELQKEMDAAVDKAVNSQ